MRSESSVRPIYQDLFLEIGPQQQAVPDPPLASGPMTAIIPGQGPIALGTFGGTPALLTDFEDDRQEVIEKLAAITAEASAGSLLLQGTALAGRTIRATGTLFSAMVILSATAAAASVEPTDEMIAPIVDSNATLHVVANRPAQTPASGQRSSPALRALAEQSRGEFTVIYSGASYLAALERLADRLTSEMLIEYLVPVGSKPNDVKVGVRIVGARVRGLGVAPR